jgi:murein DD-endopeptidase MepM/ murein hydrolase activator NlpD
MNGSAKARRARSCVQVGGRQECPPKIVGIGTPFTASALGSLLIFTFVMVLMGVVSAASAQSKPFVLPMATPPGPGTWLMGQPYGNTTGAYLRGDEWYRAGQRLHFGIDFSMPCGTPLVAIGDGEVIAVSDLSFGSAPHNLLIRHDAGYVSLYGHLLERPQLAPGMRVTQGQQVGLSGDPDITCVSRPHLHLEIRSLDFRTAYNPVALIEADWHALALIGQFRYPMFQQNLDDARRWMTLEDQPDVAFGGEALNRYAATFPPMERIFAPPNAPLTSEVGALSTAWSRRALAFTGCCANVAWHPTDANMLYLIDGAANARALLYEWDAQGAAPTGVVMSAPQPLRSPDGTHEIVIAGDEAVIRRASDGVEWRLNTGGATPSLSSDNSWVMFARTGDVALPGEPAPRTVINVLRLDGSDARVLADAPGVGALWLDASRLLITQRTNATTSLFLYDTSDGATSGLVTFDFLRGLSVAPGGSRIAFFLVYQQDAVRNSIYTLEMQPGAQPQRVGWFGAFRWRSADGMYYVPLAPGQPQELWYYDVVTGESVRLTDPSQVSFTIANGDWAVSPDGARIAYWEASDLTTWLLEGVR